MNSIAIAIGGGVRVGLEDNIWYDSSRTILASSYWPILFWRNRTKYYPQVQLLHLLQLQLQLSSSLIVGRQYLQSSRLNLQVDLLSLFRHVKYLPEHKQYYPIKN